MSEKKEIKDNGLFEEIKTLAETERWDEFDGKVLEVCNDSRYVAWAEKYGLIHASSHLRDFAISIFEQTSLEGLSAAQKSIINTQFQKETDLHLKRKLAFVLFKYNERSSEVMRWIRDAVQHDVELSKKASSLLASE